MAASLSGVFDLQAFTDLGTLGVGYRVYTFVSGTTTQKTAYTDAAGTVSQTYTSDGLGGQYIALNARGELPAPLFLTTGAYDITLKRADGTTVWTRYARGSDDAPAAVSAALSAYQAQISGPTGPTHIGFKQNYAAAVSQILGTPLSNIVSVSDFMTDQQVIDGHGGTILPDITVAFQAAVDAFPRQGSPNWQQWKLMVPPGRYTVSSTIKILNQQGGELHMGGCELNGSFAGPILQIGDLSGSNDCLRFHVYGGALIQNSTAAGSGAFLGQHLYSCSFKGLTAYGGRIAFNLDGNANLIDTLWAYGGRDSNIKAGAQSNNETNTFLNCTSQQGFGYGYDLSVVSGQGGFTKILGGYCEANAGGNILASNSEKVVVDGVYFNLQNGASGVILGGTVGANFADPQVNVRNCRILGPSSGTPAFIQELSSTSVNAIYSGNTLEDGNCNLYGAAPSSINERRRGDAVYVLNADAFTGATGATPPTGWSAGGGAPTFAIVGSPSPYGAAAGLAVSGVGYAHQLLAFPVNALLRISCWAKTTGADATLQLYDAAGATLYGGATTASGTAVRLEIFVTQTSRTSATSGRLQLRNASGTGAATFSNIVIEDMTN